MTDFDVNRYIARLPAAASYCVNGQVRGAVGQVVRAALPEAWIGELCQIHGGNLAVPLLAEVIGVRNDETVLAPIGDIRGVSTKSTVRRLGRALTVRVGPAMVGRVLNGIGLPADGRPLPPDLEDWPVYNVPPDPFGRSLIDTPFVTGVRAVDGLLTVGEGQRIGIFAGAGIGKSTLLGMIARNASFDVAVIGLVGERGREVREFLECDLGTQGMERAITIVATSDSPALVRLKAAYVATAVAEYFRARGARVLMLLDSITRFARARREVGLAAGEPPARAGFPPSVFAELPILLERAGRGGTGSITAFYTVLVEGDDHNEPVADEARSILDGHIVLSAERAGRGIFPAVDIARSVSRVMGRVVDEQHVNDARRLRAILGAYEAERDLLLMGAYEAGTDPRVDEAAAKIGDIEDFLAQKPDESEPFSATRDRLAWLARPHDGQGVDRPARSDSGQGEVYA